MIEEELGTFFLTDFLARHFETLVYRGARARPPSGAARRLFRANTRSWSISRRPMIPRSPRRPRPRPHGSALPISGALPGSAGSRNFLAAHVGQGGACMASLTILYWRDIPCQVIVKAGPQERQARTPRALHPRHRCGGDARRRGKRRRLSRRLAARRPDRLRRRSRGGGGRRGGEARGRIRQPAARGAGAGRREAA